MFNSNNINNPEGASGGLGADFEKIDLGFGFNILSLYMSMNVPSAGNT
jgi:hypothetical protein